MSIDNHPFVQGVGNVQPINDQQQAQEKKVQGVDFARILEEITSAAGRLESHAIESTADPTDMHEAMDEAEKSLGKALSLGQDLLEAYRKTIITGEDESGA